MMIRDFMTFRPIDKLLVVAFAIYALFIIAALIVVNWELFQRDARRGIGGLISRIEALTDWIRADRDEEFNPEWMDLERWKETRL